MLEMLTVIKTTNDDDDDKIMLLVVVMIIIYHGYCFAQSLCSSLSETRDSGCNRFFDEIVITADRCEGHF